jgi:hypothetical protein
MVWKCLVKGGDPFIFFGVAEIDFEVLFTFEFRYFFIDCRFHDKVFQLPEAFLKVFWVLLTTPPPHAIDVAAAVYMPATLPDACELDQIACCSKSRKAKCLC